MPSTLTLSEAAHLALQCLDLTSLNDADTPADIEALCKRAQTRFGPVAAVCVWPRFVAQARSLLPASIPVAAVANFPAGELDVALALADVKTIVEAGGNEVDVVLPYRNSSAARRLLVPVFWPRCARPAGRWPSRSSLKAVC
jgi:deoxyribose-phosphate aldolase